MKSISPANIMATSQTGRSGSTADTAKKAASDTAGKAKAAAADLADTAKGAAQDVADTATSAAKDFADQATDKAGAVASDHKETAADALSDVADALHKTGESLSENDRDAFGRYAEQAAVQIDQFQSAIRDRSVGQLLDEAERFARREPGLFVGGAFLLGIAGARFLKASASEASGTPSGGQSRRVGSSEHEGGRDSSQEPGTIGSFGSQDENASGVSSGAAQPNATQTVQNIGHSASSSGPTSLTDTPVVPSTGALGSTTDDSTL